MASKKPTEPKVTASQRSWAEDRLIQAVDTVMKQELEYDRCRKKVHEIAHQSHTPEELVAAIEAFEKSIRNHMSALSGVYVARSLCQGLGVVAEPV